MQTNGKNRRRQFEVFDEAHGAELNVDSMEEVDFVNFLNEASRLGVVYDFVYQPESFLLAEGVKYRGVDGKTKTLFQDHVYSADFMVSFNPKKYPKLAAEFKISQERACLERVDAYIDTKGTFNKNARSFSIDRKWVWQKFGIYICEVVPKKFFQKFGCPKNSFVTRKTGARRKMFAGCRSISEDLFV